VGHDDEQCDDTVLYSLVAIREATSEGSGEGTLKMDVLTRGGAVHRIAITGLTLGKVMDAAMAGLAEGVNQ
jgi:hypothetical protein